MRQSEYNKKLNTKNIVSIREKSYGLIQHSTKLFLQKLENLSKPVGLTIPKTTHLQFKVNQKQLEYESFKQHC